MSEAAEEMENVQEKKQKRSLVTGEKIKHKSVKKIKKEHKEKNKLRQKEQKVLDKKIKKMDKKFTKQEVLVESKTLSDSELELNVKSDEVNQESLNENVLVKKNEEQEKVLIVRRVEGKPVSKKRKFLNLVSFALVGFVAIFFGYMAGNFYIANVLNKVDYGAFSEEALRDDGAAMYSDIKTSGKAFDQYKAVELFVGAEYMLGTQVNYYADIEGSIQPSIGSTQVIWGYKSKKDNMFECENVSKGMVSVAEKYTWDVTAQTAKIYSASKISADTAEYPADPTWTMNLEEYRNEYGTAPDSPCVPYIISTKTYLVGSDKVTKLANGNYQLTFQLATDSSVINYVKQMKHMAGLPDYPSFKSIYVTATIDSDLKLVSLRYDESYTVMYFGVMATCTGFVSYDFTY